MQYSQKNNKVFTNTCSCDKVLSRQVNTDCIKCTGFLIKDKDYNAYDTLAVVDKLKKSVDDGDMMSEEEILQMRGDMNPDNDQIIHRSWRLKKLLK